MGLPALEFSDCYLDSPQFRERLKSHELELDKTNKFIKELIKDGKALIQALKSLSTAKRKFADSLNEFKFQCIGDAETDDEMCIAKSLQEFAAVLQNLEDERTRMVSDLFIMILWVVIERVWKSACLSKKKYDKETEKYCAVLEKHLSLSARKKESHLHEADNQVDNVRQHFYEVSLEYVFKVQEVQERKMFDFVEPLLAFLQGLFTYYHHGYELAKDFNHFKTDLTISIQNTRNRFESTRSEVESLMRKMKENPHEHKSVSQHTMEGYLFVQEKRSFVSTWVKYYCTYHREPKKVTMVLFDPKSGGKTGEEESFLLKSCTRRKTDSIEKRFCFDVEAVDRPGVITMQAMSEEDRRLWMEAMDGREPVGYHGYRFRDRHGKGGATCLLTKQELHLKTGFCSISQLLLSTHASTHTITIWHLLTQSSAQIIRLLMLPAPLMTYQYQRSFIKAAKMDNPEARVTEIHALVHRLPEKNRQMLELLMKHLANVASHHQQNLMTIANLGVVFGPTLLRPQEETVAAIMDIKFQNIVVEILIEHHERVRDGADESHRPEPKESWQHPNQVRKICLSQLNVHSSAVYIYDFLLYLIPPPCTANLSFYVNVLISATSPSPTSPRSPSWPMFSAPSSPQPTSSASSDSSPVRLVPTYKNVLSLIVSSIAGRKARALYACKAEHDSELSFIAGTIFENVHASREPGWLEGTLDGRTGLIPENYVEFL
uniref:Rho GTPase-activating protein 26 n=1 Tax=Amphiprion ocellaris TaxID=80972 RepID=A0AAQ5ZHC7_AMPOC